MYAEHVRDGDSTIPDYDFGLLQEFEASGRAGKRERSKPQGGANPVPNLKYSDIVEELVGRSDSINANDMIPSGFLDIGDALVESAAHYHDTIDEALESAFGGESGFLSDVITRSA